MGGGEGKVVLYCECSRGPLLKTGRVIGGSCGSLLLVFPTTPAVL